MSQTKKKRIGIDARFYGPLGKGLGRYTQEIVDNIIKIDEENDYVIFLAKENFDEFISPSARIKKVKVNIRCYTWREQIIFPFYILKEHLDLIHFTHFNIPIFCPIKFIVTIHDLILTKFPTVRASTLQPFLYRFKNLAYRFVISQAVRKAKKIISVSNFTKQDILHNFKVRANKIIVTYEGVANLAKGQDNLFVQKLNQTETLELYNIKGKFLLYVGNAYPHKNLEGFLIIFKKILLKYPDLYLVLVGKEDYFYNRVKDKAKELDLGDKVIFPGYVPDAKLENLYALALAYVFPSFYEGFGLPPLEAAAKGCPVISSNRSAMPEVLGEAALYFNPEDIDEFIVALEKINSEQFRQDLINKGFAQAKKYNWWECAWQTLEVYKSVLEKE
jgi:glycosyltransferase involved in cell wall biosynthesis